MTSGRKLKATMRHCSLTVRLRHPGLPVILMTGYAAPELLVDMEVIRKPFEPMQLVDRVRARLEQAVGAS